MSGASSAAVKEVKRPMTVQTVKTKAETGYLEHFEAIEPKLPGAERVRKERRDAIGRFATFGLPGRRVEEWKYTDLKSMLKEAFPPAVTSGKPPVAKVDGVLPGLDASTFVFVDGVLATGCELPVGCKVISLADALSSDGEGLGTDPLPVTADNGARAITALNTAFATGGAIIKITGGTKLEKPVHIVHKLTGKAPTTATVRNSIEMGAGAEATIIESYVAEASAERHENIVTQVSVGEGAALNHVQVCTLDEGTLHLKSCAATLAREARYAPFVMSLGPGKTRHSAFISFEGENGLFDLGGLALGEAMSHADLTLVIDHKVPHCTSRELFKCVLDGNARGVFQGKVIVQPHAQKTDGKQMAQALMLSPNAEFDSKPELEIYADDVLCGHGSTAAELDDDLIFYCRSRGIPLKDARALLIESFIGEVIDKVEADSVRESLMAIARKWLGAGHI